MFEGTVKVPLPVKTLVCMVAAAQAGLPQQRATSAVVRARVDFMADTPFCPP
jgi:hypothetical protein